MPTRNTNRARWGPKPWRARVRLQGDDRHLGMYDTWEAAAGAEKRFLDRMEASGVKQGPVGFVIRDRPHDPVTGRFCKADEQPTCTPPSDLSSLSS